MYNRKNSSKYLLIYHLIFVCKYRKKLLLKLSNDIEDIFCDISNGSDFDILKMKTDADHIHLIIKSEPNISVSQIVRRLKQISTHRIWKKKYLYLKRHFRKKKVFWSSGYFVCSIGNVSMKTVEKYIENQG
jgi:putative transposase